MRRSVTANHPRPISQWDPIDGTTLTSLGRGNALAVIAVADRGSMFDPGPCVYMEKIATGSAAAHLIDITKSPTRKPRSRGLSQGREGP